MTASLRELLERHDADAPDAIVLSGAGQHLTWRDLRAEARRIAAALTRDGVKPTDRVVFVGKNDLAYFGYLFGCALAGAVPVPLNWRLSAAELTAMIEDCGAEVVFTDEAGATAVERAEAELPAVRTIVALGQHDRWPSLTAWKDPVGDDPGATAAPDDIAFQLYTSGTTGPPKGAMFANGSNLRVLLDDISVAWGFTADDVSLVCMPLCHMGGLAWALAGMAQGARQVIVRDFAPGPVLDTMAAEDVSMAFCVPTMLSALSAAAPGSRPPRLRQMVYSGAPISPTGLRQAQDALRCDFVQIYGLTEATGAFAQLSAAEHADAGHPEWLRSAGRPYPWVEVRAVSPQTGQDVPTGQVGEIWTRSPQNMAGYWHQPERTAAALTPDGWLRTGDLGYLDDDQRIYLVDRAKDMIITGGENVYPAEVEKVLAAHPALAEAAVIGVPDDHWGETVKAVVVARPGATVDAAEVIAFCRGQLARFKCPTSVDVVDALPHTATGKVIKPALRERYWQNHDRRIH
ncbi:MAG: long-chain-fatty-acid--CoA ligase [Nocardiopsaceae bacterium]|nr:long-chain-fatty-acid--CoA ligase [Nocardiopsaceae bacterium]